MAISLRSRKPNSSITQMKPTENVINILKNNLNNTFGRNSLLCVMVFSNILNQSLYPCTKPVLSK